MSRFHFSGGIRVSQLREKYAADPHEPWLTDMPAPDPLTRSQEVALLTLRKSDHSEQMLKALLAKGFARATRGDYEALSRLQLAQRNVRGYHALTPIGHWRANNITRAIAAELGLRLVDFRRVRTGPQRLYGMSDSGNG